MALVAVPAPGLPASSLTWHSWHWWQSRPPQDFPPAAWHSWHWWQSRPQDFPPAAWHGIHDMVAVPASMAAANAMNAKLFWCTPGLRPVGPKNQNRIILMFKMELACRKLMEEPSEANLVKLLDLWSAEWKHQGRTRAVGPGAYERYATLVGLFGHGGVVGVSNATGLREACVAVNRFLRSRFPNGTWSSIAVLYNPRMGLRLAPRHSEHDRTAEPRDSSRRVQRRPRVDRRRRRGTPRPGWKSRRAAGSCEGDGWTCTTSPSASMLAATTRSNRTRAACGLSLLMFHKPMLGPRSSTGRH